MKPPAQSPGQSPGRRKTSDNEAGKEKRPRGRSSKKVAAPEDNLVALSLFQDFRHSIRERYASSSHAFDRLGGGDDANIDEAEFQRFLKDLGYQNGKLNAQLFSMCDLDSDGNISKAEFKSVFTGMNAELYGFKESLRTMFKSREKAFDSLGGKDDGRIDEEELNLFVKKHLGYMDEEKNKRLFKYIDEDQDGFVTQPEFKAFFQPQGETAKVVQFKEAIKAHFKTAKDAFDELGGKDDGRIDKDEFYNFVRDHLGYDDPVLTEQLFNVIDDSNDGYITKSEFKSLFMYQTSLLAEFRETLKRKFRTRKKAFDMLGGEDDAKIDKEEFGEVMCRELGYADAQEIEQMFSVIDKDNSGFITKAEFKGFFLDK